MSLTVTHVIEHLQKDGLLVDNGVAKRGWVLSHSITLDNGFTCGPATLLDHEPTEAERARALLEHTQDAIRWEKDWRWVGDSSMPGNPGNWYNRHTGEPLKAGV